MEELHEITVYMEDNPELKRVDECRYYADMLRWADKRGYIQLRRFIGVEFYTDMQFETALMWAVKTGNARKFGIPENTNADNASSLL